MKKKIKKIYPKVVKGSKKKVSLVVEPAIGIKTIYMSANGEPKELKFSMIEDQRRIVGPGMIPNIDIFKKIEGELCALEFSPEVIKEYVLDFNNQEGALKINFNHGTQWVDALVLNSIILEDQNDVQWIKNKWNYDLPIGSWWLELKIEDEEFWETKVKQEKFHSFSIEAAFDISEGIDYEVNLSKDTLEVDVNRLLDAMLDDIMKWK